MSAEISPLTITILGLENAGKTTLLRTMCGKKFEETLTTIGLNVEQITYKGYIIQAIDLGGQKVFRDSLWSHYATLSKGIIFVFDIFDEKRVREAKVWFEQVLTWVSQDAAIAFLANKIDLKKENKNYLTLDKIIKFFNLTALSNNPHMSFRIFEVSAKTGENVEEAKQWLLEKITSKIKQEIRISLVSLLDKNNNTLYHHFKPETIIREIYMQIIEEIRRLRESGIRQTLLQMQNLKVMIAIEEDFTLVIGAEHTISTQDLKIATRSIISAIRKKGYKFPEQVYELEGLINTILLKSFKDKNHL